MILGIRKPAKLAGRLNLEFSSFARRRSKFAEFPFIAVLQPLFPVLLSVLQIPPPAMCGRNHQPLCSIPLLQKALGRQLQLLRQWPPDAFTASFASLMFGSSKQHRRRSTTPTRFGLCCPQG